MSWETGTGQVPPAPHKSKLDAEFRREVKELAKLILWFLALFFFLKSFVLEGYEVQGPSMQPALETGDRILVFKLAHKLEHWPFFSWVNAVRQGDIIVFSSPEEDMDEAQRQYVKRVIAEGPPITKSNTARASSGHDAIPAPGVVVRIAEGRVFVNNNPVDERYLPAGTMDANEDHAALILKPGEYYVMGDNRSISKDSRKFHAVPSHNIIGKAVLRFWPLNRFGLVR